MDNLNKSSAQTAQILTMAGANLTKTLCELSLPNAIDSLYLAERLVESLCKQLKVEVAKSSFISLAVSEALCNSIQYGFHENEQSKITLRVLRSEEFLTVVLEDHGGAVPATIIEQYQRRDVNMQNVSVPCMELPVSGWGVNLVLMATANVRYERRDGMNSLEMDFTIV